jgi:hypothetical protein
LQTPIETIMQNVANFANFETLKSVGLGQGAGLGQVLNHYLKMINGSGLIMQALANED